MSDGFVTVAQCVEGLPLGRFVWELLFCAFLAWFMLGAINESTTVAFSYVSSEWPTTGANLSMMSIALACGNLVAIVVGGWAADQYGRTTVIRPALLLTACCGTVLQTARTLPQALLAHFLLGLVSGALIGVIPPLIAELLPARNRGFYMTIWCSGWPAGALLSVVVGCLSPELNWRTFHTGLVVPALVLYLCVRAEMLPESPRYLYLVGKRDEGYNTLLDIYEKEQLPLPWAAEAIAVTCAPPAGQSLEDGTVQLNCHSACKRLVSSSTTVAAWLAAATFLTSVAGQSMKIGMPLLLLRSESEVAHRAINSLTLVQHQALPTAIGTPSSVMSFFAIMPPHSLSAEPRYYVILILAQAYLVQFLGIILCAYASTWVRQRQLVRWSLASAALLTLLAVLCARVGGVALALCGPVIGLQLAAQACSVNFLQVFATEHFPTSRRAAVFSRACFAAHLGDLVAPTIGALVVERLPKGLVIAFFSTLYVMAWLVSARLPLSSSRERPLHDVDEPRCQRESAARVRKRDWMNYQTL